MKIVESIIIICEICSNKRQYKPWQLRQRSGRVCSRRCAMILRYKNTENRKRQSIIAKEKKYGYWMVGKKQTQESNSKHSKSLLGHHRGGWKLSEQTRIRMRDSALRGEQSRFWRGGICPKNAKIRSSFEYKTWRRAVFDRDNYTCQKCGERGGRLHADHIRPFAMYPELRFDINNGRTLCVDCHKKTPTFLNGTIKLMAHGAT